MPITEQTKEYFAFISYKREDEKWAKWLQHKLEHYKLPSNLNGRTDLPKEIRPIFRDQSELAGGVLADEINKALANSKYLIVICSPKAAQSQWVGKEVQTFIDLGKTDKIIPFIIGGTAHAQNPEEECFPLALLDLPPEKELLGVNIDEMGRDAAAVKVVAQMFGLKFDMLWQRYEREKRKTQRKVIGGLLAFALIMAGVTTWILHQNVELKEKDWRIMEVQTRFVVARVEKLFSGGDLQLAQKVLLEVLPKKIQKPKRPYVSEAEWALRYAVDNSQKSCKSCLTGDELLCINVGANVTFASFNSDGTLIAASLDDKTIRVFDANNGTEISVLSMEPEREIKILEDGKSTGQAYKSMREKDNEICSISFNEDNKMLQAVSVNGTKRTWDITENKLVRFSEGNEWRKKCFASNTYKGQVAKHVYVDKDNGIRIQKPKETAFFDRFEERLLGLGFGTVSVLEYRYQSTLKKHTGDINDISLNPKGDWFVTASSDSTLMTWNYESGEMNKVLRGHTDCVNSGNYSYNGKQIVSASDDGRVIVWDAESGQILKDFDELSTRVNYAEFSQDGRKIVSASSDSTIRVWSFPPLQDLIDQTRERFKDRPLTPEERHQYYLE